MNNRFACDEGLWGGVASRGGKKLVWGSRELVSAANVAEVVIGPFVVERTGSGGWIDLHLADRVNCMSCSHRSTIRISGAQTCVPFRRSEIMRCSNPGNWHRTTRQCFFLPPDLASLKFAQCNRRVSQDLLGRALRRRCYGIGLNFGGAIAEIREREKTQQP